MWIRLQYMILFHIPDWSFLSWIQTWIRLEYFCYCYISYLSSLCCMAWIQTWIRHEYVLLFITHRSSLYCIDGWPPSHISKMHYWHNLFGNSDFNKILKVIEISISSETKSDLAQTWNVQTSHCPVSEIPSPFCV